MQTKDGPVGNTRGWLVAVGLGLLAGYVLGLGASGSWRHAVWPASAGFLLGLATAIAGPSRPGLVAFCAASTAVATAVATIAMVQVQAGHWPLADEVAVAQYGTATQAVLRTAVILAVLIGVPCMVAAGLVALARRRDRAGGATLPRSRPGTAHGPSRASPLLAVLLLLVA